MYTRKQVNSPFISFSNNFHNNQFTYFLDFNQIVYLESCVHPFCKEDIKKLIFKELPEKGEVHCPSRDCGAPLLDLEIKMIIGEETQAKLTERFTKKWLKEMNLTQCPKCQNMWEHAPGKIDPNQKDDKGNKLSKEAAESFAKYRARCPKDDCRTVFCSSCNAEPFHTGYNCEEYKLYQKARKCRYCKEKIKGKNASKVPAFRNVCKKAECMELMKNACDKILPCGHPCYGCRGEKVCLPCLNEDCVAKHPETTKGQKEDDYCPICYTTGIGDAPAIMPECGHVCHLDCLLNRLKKRWAGPRITFSFCECPICRKWTTAPHHPLVNEEIRKVKEVYENIRKKAVDRLLYEGLDKDKRLNDPNDKFYNKKEEYALARLSYYMCYKCKKPYFGGLKSCENVNEGQREYKEQDLVCGSCAAQNIKGGITSCPKHGTDFIEFKCKFCCSVAQWFCWGTTHFCEPCHARQCIGDFLTKRDIQTLPRCPGPDRCPLRINHPPNGQEYSLGCAICRNLCANVKPF